ncbi:MAG: hypothetical protein O3A92_15070, partial [Verrucomicrobia bacterium]|nr:hypothetical protein [Verrucomicrobiota bacterium]
LFCANVGPAKQPARPPKNHLTITIPMTDPVSQSESAAAQAPSIQQAADDLRQAAGQKAREVANSAEERAHQLKEAAAQKAQQFREVATEKANDFKEAASEKAQRIRSVAGEKAQQIREVAGEQWQETRVKARAVHTNTEDYIREHPTKAILIAAGVGFLFGLIVRR